MTRTLEILDRLIAFPTISADSNLALIDYVQGLLQAAGAETVRLLSPCGQKAGLFARIGAGSGGVCLSAHTDVVPVAGQKWSTAPFKLTARGDRLLGRGTTDMKGFLASALACVERAAQLQLAEPLTLVISYDEEIGCVGIRQMMPQLEPLLGDPRAVIVGEPTSMQVAIGHKGKVALRVTCQGESGHSALAPEFRNAIHLAADFVTAMRELQDDLAQGACDSAYSIPYSTIHIGKIAGGTALNIVPDLAQIDMEFRHLGQVDPAALRSLIETKARQISQRYNAPNAIQVAEVNAYFGLGTLPEAPVVTWAQQLTGGTAITKVAFGTEAGFFANLGLPVVVIGPGDMAADGHQPDEGLNQAELFRCDAFMDRLLLDLKAP
ncbi:acetylornithine deacetylase [Phaeobacter sp. 11ANDIMAR09]|uniref:acetylornithine deacetylase n=1 Tax=Phaeobacter sp. 11ANDIMAR09 TaxID=1225647 RepID=UPI0006C8CEB3|nr:acetylornithine deacetylase [Phaeobacter sp. 11ANDIMAR09]KPD10734.1 acetylornithine deacetylase [Phaeobacter sp. 11ANDIMAR09]